MANGDRIARTSSWERERGGQVRFPFFLLTSCPGASFVRNGVLVFHKRIRPGKAGCIRLAGGSPPFHFLSPFVDAFEWKAEGQV